MAGCSQVSEGLWAWLMCSVGLKGKHKSQLHPVPHLSLFLYPECHLRLSLRSLGTEGHPLPSLGPAAALSWPKPLLLAPPLRGGPVGDRGKMGAAGALDLLPRLLLHHLLLPLRPRNQERSKCVCDVSVCAQVCSPVPAAG